MPHAIAPDAVGALLKPGHNVFIQGGSGEPSAILAALRATGAAGPGVHYLGVFPSGINRWDPASFAPGGTMTAFFATPELRPSLESGATRLRDMHYSEIFSYLERDIAFDVALIQVAPPNAAGLCSLGVSVDFLPAVLGRAKRVVAEINPAMPSPPGSPTLPFARLDDVVAVEHPLAEPTAEKIDPASRIIGANVATLIRDGDSIQIGVGKIPTAVLGSLNMKNDLGFHSGLLSEPVLSLLEDGNITGAGKPIDRGLAVTGIAFGSQPFYQGLGRRADVRFRPVDYTHDPDVLGRLENFVAINSAIEVDLRGRINAVFVDGRQVSGVGGLVDFIGGAGRAAHGRSVIALPAKAGARGLSRIVPEVAPFARLGAEVDYVVTEFGIAALRGRSAAARAEAIIAIAAPEFRDSLAEAAKRISL